MNTKALRPSIEVALGLHKEGNLDEAARIYQQILATDSSHADASHLLGLVFHARGNHEEALSLIRRAIAHKPDTALYHRNLGAVLEVQGKWPEALAAYCAALRLQPGYAEALLGRANMLARTGRPEEAVDVYNRLQAERPNDPALHEALGLALESAGRLSEALSAYAKAEAHDPSSSAALLNQCRVLSSLNRLDSALAAYTRAAEVWPAMAEAHWGKAGILHRLGRAQEALSACDDALMRDPRYAPAHNQKGNILFEQQRFIEALIAYNTAIESDPAFAHAYYNRGNVLNRLGRRAEAVVDFEAAIACDPSHGSAYNNLGTALVALGRTKQALEAFNRALSIKPDHHSALANRANALVAQGRFREAALDYEQALRLDPTATGCHSDYLNCLNYDPTRSDAELLAAHAGWGERHGKPEGLSRRHGNNADLDRRLRVGLVSADLGRHPVGYLLQPLLEAADPEAVVFCCYSGRLVEDDLSERLRQRAQIWRRTERLSDRELADTITADGIDILIDLAGHTPGNRLGCFALKPAPVQVHWAGYAGTTGLAAIDYAQWDAAHVPEGDERWFTETVVRLPVRWCYSPPEYAPAVVPPPVQAQGHVTFGSFNNLTKLSPETVEVWSGILGSVAGSRLLLSWKTLGTPEECERIRSLFAAHGLAPERIELSRGAAAHAAVLGQYGRVDIALDPFPYSGGLTTLEALWMGVPVLTLPASRPASRQSASLLAALGRDEWIAHDRSNYLRLAVDMARDEAGLAAARRDQRQRMLLSPLCDGTAFARSFEAALRQLWGTWCGSTAPARP